MLLTLVTFLPLLAAAVVFCLPQAQENLIK